MIKGELAKLAIIFVGCFGCFIMGAAVNAAVSAESAQAAPQPSNVEVVCGEPADAGVWQLMRCEGDWGEVCFVASSGFVACKFE